MNTKWLELFKIAIIEEDIKKLETLLKEIPEFKKIDDLKSAYRLINEAKDRFEIERKSTKSKLDKIDKAREFFTKERVSTLNEIY